MGIRDLRSCNRAATLWRGKEIIVLLEDLFGLESRGAERAGFAESTKVHLAAPALCPPAWQAAA